MHFLITGGAGFIGTHLTLRLLNRGHKVTVLDNGSTGRTDRLKNTPVRLIQDSVLEKDVVFRLVKDSDYVIHLASVVGVRLAMAKGLEMLKLSYLGTENVLEAALQYEKEVFIASSSAIYGKILHSPVSEDDDSLLGSTRKASWLYSVGKLTEEHLAFAYARERKGRIKIGRFFNVIGPFQTGNYGMVVPRFIRKALLNEPLPVYEKGLQTRTFAYIEDILDGLEIVIHKGAAGEVYNIGGTEEVRIVDLAAKIIKLTKSNSEIMFIPFKQAFGEDFEETMQRVPDITKLKALGYSPRFSFEDALSEIVTFHKGTP